MWRLCGSCASPHTPPQHCMLLSRHQTPAGAREASDGVSALRVVALTSETPNCVEASSCSVADVKPDSALVLTLHTYYSADARLPPRVATACEAPVSVLTLCIFVAVVALSTLHDISASHPVVLRLPSLVARTREAPVSVHARCIVGVTVIARPALRHISARHPIVARLPSGVAIAHEAALGVDACRVLLPFVHHSQALSQVGWRSIGPRTLTWQECASVLHSSSLVHVSPSPLQPGRHTQLRVPSSSSVHVNEASTVTTLGVRCRNADAAHQSESLTNSKAGIITWSCCPACAVVTRVALHPFGADAPGRTVSPAGSLALLGRGSPSRAVREHRAFNTLGRR
eukprot:3939607-Rhodomonas_salina.1